MFNVCRIPETGRDRLTVKHPSSPHFKKVVVMLHNWIYSIDVYSDRTGPEGASPKHIGFPEIERRLREVVVDARDRMLFGDRPAPIGILTSDERDTWAKVL